ncbi:hypothetical protein GCM10009122_16100 [Fulvivirga kasyanovii]|uniref:Macro domain-containing protein n=1 Tax=Fulvivirga kasyanovii TaxID=396812 RepID=A0ABW9RNL6_9BACT|nr:hypothetical protein [Fulvivirga kasyanovii]MTI24540.1 hypothetical protein [Fulvivirga kasyanovii]
MWFKKLTGFDEISPEYVREHLLIEGTSMTSKINGKSYRYGELQVPTLKELKAQAPPLENFDGRILVSEVIANVQQIHRNVNNANALIQAASQFNLLEMTGPHVTPEQGVDGYEHDFTQGPACAIACGAGTIYRNYFTQVNGRTGQSSDNQIDCLELIGTALGNEEFQLWKMNNGYALLSQEGLLKINSILAKAGDGYKEALKDKLKIGLQWQTEVTLADSRQIVSQAYCSALPVAYTSIEPIYWERFARLILEASYEATLYAAVINLEKTGCPKVFLTLVGGGAFGNDTPWITDSIAKAISKFNKVPLDVKIVSYGSSNAKVVSLVEEISRQKN